MDKTKTNMITDIQASCSRCGAIQTLPFHAGINVAQEPELKARVRDGSLFLWECPRCGARNLLSGQTLYHDPEGRLMIWLLPEGTLAEDQVRAVESQMEGLEGYTLRRVPDVGGLIEKVHIHEAGLDDVVMELCKHVTRLELADTEKKPELLEAPFRFFRMDGPDNRITFSYPREGRMFLAETGFRTYEDCRGIVQRNPAMHPEEGRFARVDAAWIDRFFR